MKKLLMAVSALALFAVGCGSQQVAEEDLGSMISRLDGVPPLSRESLPLAGKIRIDRDNFEGGIHHFVAYHLDHFDAQGRHIPIADGWHSDATLSGSGLGVLDGRNQYSFTAGSELLSFVPTYPDTLENPDPRNWRHYPYLTIPYSLIAGGTQIGWIVVEKAYQFQVIDGSRVDLRFSDAMLDVSIPH